MSSSGKPGGAGDRGKSLLTSARSAMQMSRSMSPVTRAARRSPPRTFASPDTDAPRRIPTLNRSDGSAVRDDDVDLTILGSTSDSHSTEKPQEHADASPAQKSERMPRSRSSEAEVSNTKSSRGLRSPKESGDIYRKMTDHGPTKSFLNASHLWCLVTKTHNLEVQMHELPARALPLLRSFRDVAVIPGGHDATREFAEFCKEVLSLSENQVVFTSDEQRTFMETSEGFEESVKLRIREAISSSVDSWILMPFAITDALLDLANDLVNEIGEGRIFMFGESLEWMNQFGGKTVLHRHIKNLDQESFVERVNPGIRVAKGFVCSTVQQLLVSFNLLTRQGTPHSDSPSLENTLQGTSSPKRLHGNSSTQETSVKPVKEGSKVVIKPIFGPAGEGHIVVSSVEELRLYDFPFGDVVMEEMLSMDKASDGTHASPSVQYLGNQIMPHLIDKIVVGNSVYGLRTSSASPEFIATICDWTQQLVDAMAPHGMSSFGFLPVNGEPVLTDTHAGSLTTEHFTKLFHQMYGGGCTFCSWNQHPRTGLDVWQFWARLCDRNIAFTPTKDTRGVFPLLFLKNTTATFIALGRDEADVAELRKAAEDLLRDAPVTYRMDSAALSESQRRIWIHSPRPHGRRETLEHSIPARVISLLRPHLDVVILPGCHEPTREFWEFSRDILELDDDQAIFTAGDRLPLDDDIDENIIARLRSIISASQDKWTLVPYCVTPNFQRWSRHLAGLEVTVFGEDLDAVEKYGHHGVLHRHVRTPDTPSVIEQIDPRIRVPRGYVCSTVEDLLEARRLLDIKSLLVKPVHRSTCGEGVLLLTEAEQLRMYDFPLGDVCLEECLVPDKAPDGMALALSMHYNEGVPLGNPVDKLTLGFGGRSLGWRDTRCRKTLQKTANQYLQSITAATNPKGPGGMDFLSAQGKLFLLDLNFGCFTWNHSPKLFQERYAPTYASYYWQCKPALDADVYAVWSRLEGVGIAFHPGRSTRGVYPLLFLRGSAATFIAIAETTEAAEALRRVADSCIKIFDKTVPTVSVVVPKPSFFKKADIMKKSSMRIWATSSSEEMQRPFRRIESSARPICVLRPGKDVVILQGGSDTLRDYFEFCREVLRLHDDQVVWTTGKANCLCLDREIDEGVVGRIRDIVVSRPDDSFMLVPMEVSDSFQSWAAGLQDLTSLKVFGETPDWVLTHASKRIMFRSAATPNIPSILEKAAPGCKFLKGYICSSCEELSTAFELLRQDGVDVNGSEGLLLMPSHVGGRMSSTIHSVEELALYDFPFGDVVLQEVRKLDQAPDGLTLIVGVSYLKGSPFGQGFTDCVALGHRIQGIRKSCTSPEFQDRVIRIVNQLLRELQPKGPGTFEFSSIDGEPVLIDVETNRFNPMHYAKLFHEMYAPDSCFACWNFHPPAGLDVWSFWGRLCDRDVAFTPQSHRGVFPLLFLQRQNSTGTAMFIAIGRDESDVAQVKGIAEEALRELPEEHIKAQVSDQYGTLSGAVRRMWFLNVSADADKTRGQQRFIFPAGLCTLLRRDLDVVVFPWSNPPSREYWEFIRDVLDLNDDQAVFPSTEKPSTEEVDEDLLVPE